MQNPKPEMPDWKHRKPSKSNEKSYRKEPLSMSAERLRRKQLRRGLKAA